MSKVAIIIITLILAMGVGLAGCGERGQLEITGIEPETSEQPTLTPTPTLKPEYYPFESWEAHDAAKAHAQLLVVERLQKMAQTHEAKEYVGALISARSWGLCKYDAELQAWRIVIHGFLPDNWRSFVWLPSDYIDILEEYWHGGPNEGADWVVYDNGKITPLANGFRVETDIEQLNSARTLK